MNIAMAKPLSSLIRADVFFCILSGVVFFAIPSIDIWFSTQFYDGGAFYLHDNVLVSTVYKIFAKIHFAYLLVFIFALLWLKFFYSGESKNWQKRLRFLLLVLLLVPGLIVNIGLKDNSFGRPRPVHIEQFGGDAQFAPAFTYSGQCAKNCSFVSGHAAIATFFIAFAWILGSRRLFLLGMTVGALVGLVRIVQGGHFLSDVVFSLWIMYFGTLILAYRFRFRISSDARQRHFQ